MFRVDLAPTEIRAETDETDHFDVIPRLGVAAIAITGHDVLRPKASGKWDAVGWFNETTNQDVAAGLIAGVGSLAGVRVRIPAGINLTYNREDAAPADLFTLEIGGGLTFDNVASRTLKVGTIYVLPDDQATPAADAGQLSIRFPDSRTTATIVFTDMGWSSGNQLVPQRVVHNVC